MCSPHAAHWTTTRYAGHARGCGAAEATQEACRSGERCGVPSVAAIGPFGGRGVPSGRWALTLSHSLDNRLETADEVLEGRAAKEGDVERLGVVRSAGSLGGGSVTAVGPPTRGTAMLRGSYRLCTRQSTNGGIMQINSSSTLTVKKLPIKRTLTQKAI